jgi:hypothetical protein
MICTPTFSFIHLHKTGGQTISELLLNHIPGSKEIGYHLPVTHLPLQAKSLPVLGVIRNPWDWYVSWYAFNNLRGVKNPLFNIVSRGKQAGFNETIENLLRYPEINAQNEIFKNSHRALLPENFENDGGAGFTKDCVDFFRSNEKGYYSLLVERMFGEGSETVNVLRFERLAAELKSMMNLLEVREAGEFLAALDQQPRKNSSARGHYAHYYDDELRDLVAEKEESIIQRFCYEFEAPPENSPAPPLAPGKRVKKVGDQRVNFLSICEIQDVSALKAKVAELTEADWAESDRHTQFDIHKETQSIQLLGDDMSHTLPQKTRYFDLLADDVAPIIERLKEHFGHQGVFLRALIARLNAHSQIKPHVDKGYSLINCNRVHIPLFTNDKVQFSVGGESRTLKEGEVWEINNADVHAVTNTSDSPRIHLIIDWTPRETLLREKKPFRMDLPMFYRSEFRLHS